MLGDQEVQERTDTTIKLSNVTGQSAEEVSSYMTAIWNNFDDGSESLEHYADVITALGASTASSSKEIAEGLEKFASVGETVGLSYDYATAALATVVAQTRQSADVVGTSFKTLFSRLQGLKLGETLDDGTDLNKYSKGLAAVGVDIKTASGELKDMDIILDELGARWKTLSKDQQVALAQTVGGVRQYNQMISLMDNWDIFKQNLETARGAEGALQEQADIYAESWEAASKNVKASLQGIYQDVLDDKTIIKLTQATADIVSGIDNIIEATGGMKTILIGAGLLIGKMFKNDIANGIDTAIVKMGNFKTALGQTRNWKDFWSTGQRAGKIGQEQVLSQAAEARQRAIDLYSKSHEGDDRVFLEEVKSQNEVANLDREILELSDKINDNKRIELETDREILITLNKQKAELAGQVKEAREKRFALTERQSETFFDVNTFTQGYRKVKRTSNLGYGSQGKAEEMYGRVQSYVGDIATLRYTDNKKGIYGENIWSGQAESRAKQLQEAYTEIEKTKRKINEDENITKEQIEEELQKLNQVLAKYEDIEGLRDGVKNKKQLGQKQGEIEDSLYLLGYNRKGATAKEIAEADIELEKLAQASADADTNASRHLDNIKAKLKEVATAAKEPVQAFMDFANGAAQAMMGISMLSGGIKTLTDDSATLGDKVAALSSVLMAVPMILHGISAAAEGLAGVLTVTTGGAYAIIVAIGLLVGALVGIPALLDKIHKSTDELIEEGDKLKQSMSELSSELETLKNKLDELKEQRKLKITNKEDTKELDKQIDLLERQIKLKELDLSIQKKEAVENAKQKLESTKEIGSKGATYSMTDQGQKSAKWTFFHKQEAYSAEEYVDALSEANLFESSYNRGKIGFGGQEAEYYDTILYNLKEIKSTYETITSDESLIGTQEYHEATKKLENILEIYTNISKAKQIDLSIIDSGIDQTKFDSLFGNYKQQIYDAAIKTEGQITEKTIQDIFGGEKNKEYKQFLKGLKDNNIEIDQYISRVNSAAIESLNFEQSLEDAAGAADDATGSVSSLSASIEKFDKVAKGIKDLQTAFGEFKEDGKVSYDTISSIMDNFSNVEGIEDYVKILADADTTTAEFNKTLSDLTYEKIRQSMTDEEIVEAGEDVIRTLLESYGVTNAATVAQNIYKNALGETKVEFIEVATAEQKKAASDVDVLNKSELTITALRNQAIACGTSTEGFIDLVAQETVFNNSKIKVSDKIAALEALAITALGAANALTFQGYVDSLSVPELNRLYAQGGDVFTGYWDKIKSKMGKLDYGEEAQYSPKKSKSGSSGKQSKSGADYSRKDPVADRYHAINSELERNKDLLDDINKIKDKAYGQNHIKAINDEIKALKTNISLYKKQYNQAKEYQKTDKATLTQTAKDWFGKKAKTKFAFDSAGNITNLEKVQSVAEYKANKAINAYNALQKKYEGKGELKAAQQKQLDAAAKKADQAKQKYDELMKAVNQYEESVKQANEAQRNMYDSILQMRELKLETIQYKVDLQLDIDERQRKLVQRKIDKLFDTNEYFGKTGGKSNLVSLSQDKYNTYKADYDKARIGAKELLKAQGLTDKQAENILTGGASEITKLAKSGLLDTDEVEALKDFTDKMLDATDGMDEALDDFLKGFDHEIEVFEGKLQKALDKNELIRTRIETTRDIMNLLGQGITGQTSYNVNKTALQGLQATYISDAISYSRISKGELTASGSTKGEISQSAIKDTAAQTFKDLTEQLKDSSEKYGVEALKSFKEALNINQEILQLDIEEAGKNFEKSVVGAAHSLESAIDKYEQARAIDDLKYSQFFETYNLNKLNREIQKELEGSPSGKYNQALLKIQNKIAGYLADGKELTKAQLEILQAEFELEKANAAYEQSKNAKDQIRMQRDASGNWNYVYTADANQIAQAEQAREDAMVKLVEANNTAMREAYENYLQTAKDSENRLQELYTQLSSTTDEAEQERIRIAIDEENKRAQETLEIYKQNFETAQASNQELIKLYGPIDGIYETISDIPGAIEELDFNPENLIQELNSLGETLNKNVSDYTESNWKLMEAFGWAAQDKKGNWYVTETGKKAMADGIRADDKMEITETTVKAFTDAVSALTGAVGPQFYNSFSDWKTQAENSYESIISLLGQLTDDKNERVGAKDGKLTPNEWISVNTTQTYTKEGTLTKKTLSQELEYKYTGNAKKINGETFVEVMDGAGNTYWIKRAQINTESFDTGGYTGDWGGTADGKLAMLHEKELVLNQNDTKNFLEGIKILRDIQLPRLFDIARDKFKLNYQKVQDAINQNVTITAEFPNATNHLEIEEAFNNLINSTTQYINK